MRALAALAAAAVLVAQAAAARPFTVDDLLHAEAFGAVAVDPTGRWLVAERGDAYDTARRYDAGFATSEALSRLLVTDLRRPGPARPLIVPDAGAGWLIAGFSPGGRRLAVYRIEGHAWRLGVVDLQTGAARVFPITPEPPRRGRALQWLSDEALLVLARPDGQAPADRHDGWLMAERLPGLLETAAAGGSAHTVLGSGAYAPLRARRPPDRLLRLDATTGAVTPIAEGAFIDLELSPDHRRAALMVSGADVQPRPDGPVRGAAGSETERSGVVLVDLRTGAVLCPQVQDDLLPNLLAWSPSGRRLLLYARGADGLWTHGALRLLDTASGAVTPLAPVLDLEARFNPVRIRAGWMGETPIAYARPKAAPDAPFDWYALDRLRPLTASLPGEKTLVAVAPSRLTVIAGSGLWRVGLDRDARRIAAGPARPAIAAFRGTQGSRLINAPPAGSWLALGPAGALAWTDERGAQRIGVAPPDTPLETTIVAASHPARAAVVTETDAHGVGRLRLLQAAGPPVVLSAVNAGLADTDAPRVRPVRHTDRDGRPLTSWLFLPATSPTPPPLIVRPYLGSGYPRPPQDGDQEAGVLQNLRMLTGHGYAVLVPSLPNPPGGLAEPMDHLAERILGAVDAARADPALKGLFDGDRLALMGWSFGGYTTMAAITQTDRFRAAVEMEGISDLTAYWSSLGARQLLAPEDGYLSSWHTGTVEATQPELGAPPWAAPDRYRRNSPLFAADRIHTPLLLIHGYQDGVPIEGSAAMYSALFRQGKDALFVTYWGALHTLTSPGDVRDLYARTFAFLDQRLDFTPAADAAR